MRRQTDLIEAVREYDPDVDEDALNRAYIFAMQAHGSQKRANGDPYFSHPVEVAYFLTGLKLDEASIITALLHDTVEDTEATLEQIGDLFGDEVRTLVDGVTKLNRLEIKSQGSKQAENFRKLVVAMSEDLRVLLVKLADRMHNMSTLHFIPKADKRKRIAQETMDIYAPLAERIGMRQMKEELQDMAFAEIYSEARESIVKRLDFLRKQGKNTVEDTVSTLRNLLNQNNIFPTVVEGREKRPYSIWRKMEMKNVPFEQLSDIIAFRVMVKDMGECYAALGVIHSNFHTIPGKFKDYISTPKANGYQSIHTSIIGPDQHRIEVQIRTQEMHDIAEYGVAAHWSYKQRKDYQLDGKQFRWIRELLEILEKTEDPDEFLEHTKLEMYHDQVFCFTPKGDIIALPRAATPVDFAFAVHSKVGQSCVGAKINGRIVPLKTQLRNGDQVEIITSKSQTPSPAWERFVVTGKARSEIRKYIRTQQRAEYVTLGRAILQKTFKQEGKDLSDKMLESVLATFKLREIEELLAEVGEGNIGRAQVYQAVFGDLPEDKKQAQKEQKTKSLLFSKVKKTSGSKSAAERVAMPIRGLIPGMALHFGGCCHPIPGDQIVGIVTTGKGITVHTMDCETLENFSDSPERWIDVSWDTGGKETTHYVGRIRANLSHETAALATLANVISRENGNINNLKIVNRSTDYFELLVDIEVEDVRHLNNIIAGLRSKDVVQSVERFSG
jgi:guanosine-3',5'-bis(diphosphate) 3'-pyrophosphohydrolase